MVEVEKFAPLSATEICRKDVFGLLSGKKVRAKDSKSDCTIAYNSTLEFVGLNSYVMALAARLLPGVGWTDAMTWECIKEVLLAVDDRDYDQREILTAKIFLGFRETPDLDDEVPFALSRDGRPLTLREVRRREMPSETAEFSTSLSLRKSYCAAMFTGGSTNASTFRRDRPNGYAWKVVDSLLDAIEENIEKRAALREKKLSKKTAPRVNRVGSGPMESETESLPSESPSRATVNYLSTAEWFTVSSGRDVSCVELHISNRMLSNHPAGSYVLGAPKDEEWNSTFAISEFSEVMDASVDFLAVLDGWQSSYVIGRTLCEKERRGWKISRPIDPPDSRMQRPWGSIDATFHVRRWIEYRDIDNGYFDVWITPSSDPFQIRYSVIENDPEIIKFLANHRKDVDMAVRAVVRALLDKPLAEISGREAVWEEESVVATGGDGYRLRYMITSL